MAQQFLFVLEQTEDGFHVERIDNFEKWVAGRIDGVKREKHPNFLWTIPPNWPSSGELGVVLIRGEIVVPQAEVTVLKYVLK